jgi:hypothetical protein
MQHSPGTVVQSVLLLLLPPLWVSLLLPVLLHRVHLAGGKLVVRQ